MTTKKNKDVPGEKERVEETKNFFDENGRSQADEATIQKLHELLLTDHDKEDEEDCFEYDGGITTPYENTELEFYILKKILLEQRERDDAGFFAKELSFDNNSLFEISRIINRLIEDKILHLSANSRPETWEEGGEQGIASYKGFINWQLVKNLDNDSEIMDNEYGAVIFDTEVDDIVRLKGILDVAVEEFMSDKQFNEMGWKIKLSENDYSYKQQRDVLLDYLCENQSDNIRIELNDFYNPKVSVIKTLLALEKENVLRIKDLGNIDMYDSNDEKFHGQWSKKDKSYAIVQPINFPSKSVINSMKLDNNVTFDDSKSCVIVCGRLVQLPPNKNEHFFCKALFKYSPGEYVEWIDIYESITGSESENSKKDKRTVQDTMYRINKRVQDVLGIDDDIFTWQEKSIKRNY